MNRLVHLSVFLVFAVGIGCSDGGGCSSESTGDGDEAVERAPDATSLPAPSEFESIDDDEERSRAMFAEIGEVLLHPRCVNCHPTGKQPRMGDESRPHQPLVERGKAGMGKPGMRCTSCHGNENYRNVPGRPGWRLAPAKMAWEGKSLAQICRQIKDPERNGGKSIEDLVEHMSEDMLVGYGWNPPDQYEPVPGTQEQFGALAEAWAESGAHCPKSASE